MAPPPGRLAQATTTLRTIRSGGTELDAKRLVAALETVGCTAIRVLPRQGPVPLEYVIGGPVRKRQLAREVPAPLTAIANTLRATTPAG